MLYNDDDVSFEKVISGGQDGVDQVALKISRELGITTGGYAPKGFMTSSGRQPKLKTYYSLQELDTKGTRVSISGMYIERSKKNVDVSDGTIAIRYYDSIGTDKTIGYCIMGYWGRCNLSLHTKKNVVYDKTHIGNTKYKKPLLIITGASSVEESANDIKAFITDNKIKVLNVCGHRELDRTQLKNTIDVLRNGLESFRKK